MHSAHKPHFKEMEKIILGKLLGLESISRIIFGFMFSFALFLQQVLKEGSFSSCRMQQHSKNPVVKLSAYPVPGGLLDMRRDLQYKKR